MNMIRIAAIGIVAALSFWGAVAAAAAHPAGEAPELDAPETIYDFGAVVEGRAASHVFVITNKGNAPLQILEVKSG